LRSFDLVWMLHIVGDLHQPLHATAMFCLDLPANGDRGGNKVMVTTPTSSTLVRSTWSRTNCSGARPKVSGQSTGCHRSGRHVPAG
jgi:hypothetical protein